MLYTEVTDKKKCEERQEEYPNSQSINHEQCQLSDIDDEFEVKRSEVRPPNVKNQNRVRWAKQQKQLVLKYFEEHIKSKTATRKNECLTFINKNSNLFSASDWVRIKTLVYNIYRDKKVRKE